MRRQCLLMARNNRTPVDYWLSLSLRSLCDWIRDSNMLIQEENDRISKGR